MRKVQIEDGKVVNIIAVDPEAVPEWCADWPDAEVGVDIGHLFDGKTFTPAPEPEPVLDRSALRLSFAQLMIGLVSEGWLSEAEGEAWLQGTLPSVVGLAISLLPKEQQFAAKAKAARMSYADRTDPLVDLVAKVQNRSQDEVDALFLTYAKV